MMNWNDKELERLFLEGDPTVHKMIYQELGPIILGYLLNNSGKRSDFDDLFQQTTIIVWQKVRSGKYKSQNRFGHYFVKVAMNTWLDILKKRDRNPEKQFSDYEHLEIPDNSPEMIAELVVKDKELDALNRALSQMAKECREFFKLFYTDKIPLNKIAEMYNLAYNTMKQRMFSCRTRLRKQLESSVKNDEQ